MTRSIALLTVSVFCSSSLLLGQLAPSGPAAKPAQAFRYQSQALPPQIERKLDRAVGQPVYACYRTGMIQLESREQDGKQVLYYGPPVNPDRLDFMAPWKVLGIDLLNQDAGWSFFGLRLLVNGSVMVVNGIAFSPEEMQSLSNPFDTLAERAGLFTTVKASGIHFTDLDAVRTREIHPGMSEQEVACALGPPEESAVDDVGRLKTVYDGGRLEIYLAGGKVSDVKRGTSARPVQQAANRP